MNRACGCHFKWLTVRSRTDETVLRFIIIFT
nr:MAG TPA: hypothetical protein [Caudoviricetes sp.]